MAETFCTLHTGKRAVGFCSKCNKPYCEDCLDMETGKPLCRDCLKNKTAPSPPGVPAGVPPKPAVSAPMAGSPLNFKGKGLEDDPLGLFGGGGPKTAPPKLNAPADPSKPPVIPTAAQYPAPPATSTVPSPPSKPSSPLPGLDQLGKIFPTSEKPQGSAPKAPMNLDSLIREPQPMRPPFPQPAPTPPLPTPSSPIPTPSPVTSSTPFPLETAGLERSKKSKIFSLVKIWAKYLLRRAYEAFDPLAKKLRIPTFVVIAALAVLLVGGGVGLGSLLNQPSVPMVDSIQPLHFVEVNSNQVSEMDITAYTDLQNQLQTMGFQPILQMTVPQLPSPNFFDVGMKEDAGVYSEIIKMPGQLTPHLSFVTVFTNGVWFSTNAWQGTNQDLTYLFNEYYLNDTPDQLYVQHMQTLEKLKQDKEWDVQTNMSENRYMSALSDHLRWFMDKKGIQAYQADFNLWH